LWENTKKRLRVFERMNKRYKMELTECKTRHEMELAECEKRYEKELADCKE
jgi:hypothetical protein